VCERVYYAGHRGLCLAEAPATDLPVTIWAQVFDERFERRQRFPLTGLPSRLRLSPDGRRAAATLFSSGHSYSEHGFATTSAIFDLESGTVAVPDLEQFAVSRDGAIFKRADFNFWGVTFARDADTFYATLSSGGHNYLIRGSVDGRTAHVIHEGVECPSLSPDGARLAFKKRIGGASGWWQLTLLDLQTFVETPLWNESRSVDDQVEWLDDAHVMYHLTGASTAADIWSAAVDGKTPPSLVLADAYSPAVLRTTQVVIHR
jgi:Tol biopolymer transport system component